MKLFGFCYEVKANGALQKTVAGVRFSHPIGLAAGFDKNAECLDAFACSGLAFAEVGTSTPLPQVGNPKKRLFRLKRDKCVINRMGFNNLGSEVFVENLKRFKAPRGFIVGANVGCNKDAIDRVEDYRKMIEKVHPYCDYITINISSPNTPNLRLMQSGEHLSELLKMASGYVKKRPIFLKVAPDMAIEQLKEIVDTIEEYALSGIILANTTISRDFAFTSKAYTGETGGLSGKFLFPRTLELVKEVRKYNKKIAIIAVGGIDSPERAEEVLAAGADLVQIYTGFIYEGPSLLKRILKRLNHAAH